MSNSVNANAQFFPCISVIVIASKTLQTWFILIDIHTMHIHLCKITFEQTGAACVNHTNLKYLKLLSHLVGRVHGEGAARTICIYQSVHIVLFIWSSDERTNHTSAHSYQSAALKLDWISSDIFKNKYYYASFPILVINSFIGKTRLDQQLNNIVIFLFHKCNCFSENCMLDPWRKLSPDLWPQNQSPPQKPDKK